MGTSPSPLTHSSSGAASAAGKRRKGCLFLKMPFAIQVPSTWFYSAASYTRHQTSPRLLCAESFPHAESCLDPPCVFQSISPVRHADKLKQAISTGPRKRVVKALPGMEGLPPLAPCPSQWKSGKLLLSQLPAWGFSPPPAPTSPMPTGQSLARRRKCATVVAGWGSDGDLHNRAPSEGGDFAANVS